jgi:hypothetical protein
MATKKSPKKTQPTFEVRFVGRGVSPDRIPLRTVSDALSAVQDLASGRDRFETPHVPAERAIGLVDVRLGSAVYACVSRSPLEARQNLERVGRLVAQVTGPDEEDGLAAALGPIEELSKVARSLDCRVEVVWTGENRVPLVVIGQDDFQRLSSKLFLEGDTTVVGRIERVGGATGMRCLLRVPGRTRILYCDVESRDLVRRLGQHLYEDIAARGAAVWIHRSWRLYKFTIRDFSQPRLGDSQQAIQQLREAGLKAWDDISDPESFIRELCS